MFLTDREILALIGGGAITGIMPLPADPYSQFSPVQPCSIDLTIGRIFVPGTSEDELGGAKRPKESHLMPPGHAALVETAEIFALPPDTGGIVTTPNRLSLAGLWLSTPSHVDPGFHGQIQFSVLNMSSQAYQLSPRGDLCTVLLFKLQYAPERDYQARGPNPNSAPQLFQDERRPELLSRLSPELLEVTKRTEKVVKDETAKAWRNLGLGAFVLAVVGVIGTSCAASLTGLSDVRRDVAETRVQLTERVNAIETRQALEERIRALELARTPSVVAPPTPAP